MRIYYTLTTIDPIIVSQNNATTTNHKSLDYIPGSAILGACAAENYAHFSTDQNWKVFHSGQVKFSPCYPVINEEIALPVPASWYFSKIENDNLVNQGKYNTAILTNHCATNFTRDEAIQYKQCRTGFVNSNGYLADVKIGTSTKTALNRDTGTAENSQLFTYSFIEAGQTFGGWIDINDGDNDVNMAIQSLLSGSARIGRSKNTEFGRVKLNIVETLQLAKNKNINNNKNELVLWCLSDCEFINEAGLPTLTPSGKCIHASLENATLNAQKSFIRSAKVSRFNQKRQGLDTEQVLVAKGSILTFTVNEPLDNQILKDISANEVGINQQYGLGWLSVNPPWSLNDTLNTNKLYQSLAVGSKSKPKVENHTKTASKSSALLQWVKLQVNNQDNILHTQQNVNYLVSSIISLYQSARKYHHILHSNEAGPSSTQWRRISEEVRVNSEQWSQNVFTGDHAICKAKNDELGWGITLATNAGQTTLADEVKTLLQSQNIETMRLLLEQLCRYDLSKYKQLKTIAKKYNVIEQDEKQRSYVHG